MTERLIEFFHFSTGEAVVLGVTAAMCAAVIVYAILLFNLNKRLEAKDKKSFYK